jgi:hypothetical protein
LLVFPWETNFVYQHTYNSFFVRCSLSLVQQTILPDVYIVFMLVPPQLRKFSSEDLLPPLEVPVPVKEATAPEFLYPDWLEDSVAKVLCHYQNADDGSSRVPPMAFVRCSRGGKTRAMNEMASILRKRTEACVLFVSFNDFSSIASWEQRDPVGALCRRIAFAARKDRSLEYEAFAKAEVTSDQIIEWLGDTPRILVIDELNKIDLLWRADHSEVADDLGLFLKSFFLMKANSYFIFSSHIVSLTEKLSKHMTSPCDRDVIVWELPTIRSVADAARVFNIPMFNARTALYLGLVPALIYAWRITGERTAFASRTLSVNDCIQRKLVSDASIEILLSSFISGEAASVPEPLLYLMDPLSVPKGNVVRWIPFHMLNVLMDFSKYVSPPLQTIILSVDKLFEKFCDANYNSGEAWEALFVIALLLRVASHTFDEHIFPKPLNFSAQYSYSFNELFCKVPNGKSLEEVHNLEEYISCFEMPDNVPHIAVYYPQHSNFETYDVIVAAYDKYRNRVLYGYQLKEGAKTPAATMPPSEMFKHSVWVRGQAAKSGSSSGTGWKVPSTGDIETFFGESGRHWTPAAWKRLSNSESRSSTSTPSNSTG